MPKEGYRYFFTAEEDRVVHLALHAFYETEQDLGHRGMFDAEELEHLRLAIEKINAGELVEA